ncbi:hypothetical protein AURDEDRAFT_163454 [Auricularia subglabra TFB-10046 SS5]|nr:hypothetical protein AURDEDRAFT_163454 [Auricularia subglabra TFB-10046 SS5]
MDRHHGADNIPAEILSIIFDPLSLDELLSASRVCRLWRAVAFRHNTFWRDVLLGSLSTTSLDCFRARIAAGSSRSVVIRVFIPVVESPDRLRSIVLPLLAHNLHRVDKLHVRIDIAYDLDLVSALMQPAPRLDTLDLYMVHETRASGALPADLFASHAPNLRYVRLVHVQLCADRLPRAFSAIKLLRCCFNLSQSFPTAIFAHAKSLQYLTIIAEHFSMSLPAGDTTTHLASNLRKVEAFAVTGGLELMQQIPAASVPEVCVAITAKPSAGLLLGHLRGTLEVRMFSMPRHVGVQYRSLDSGMKRTFICPPAQVDKASLPRVYTAADLALRVESVHCEIICVGLLLAFRTLQSCTRVVLSLTNDDSLKPPRRPLWLPRLKHIDVSSDTQRSLGGSNLAAFFWAAFLPGSRVVQVTLNGVSIDGEFAALLHGQFVLSSGAQL